MAWKPHTLPKDHWTLKTGYFEDLTPAIQVQTLPLEGSSSLGLENCCILNLKIYPILGKENDLNQTSIMTPPKTNMSPKMGRVQ